MGHLHSSAGCLCCSAMGVNLQLAVDPREGSPAFCDRVSPNGLDHIYLAEEAVQVEILDEKCLAVPQPAESEEVSALQAVIQEQQAKIEEQAKRLESASYRLGYLEAQLNSKDEQLKLLCDNSAEASWWSRLRRWFMH